MQRKKEPKELIEVLLREQRKRTPEGQDPLEGIEWGGLPDDLRDKVYKPAEQKEPLVDLLLSVEREKRRAREGGEAPQAAGMPERPGLRERWGAWAGHTFGFLGAACEVRVATVVAFIGCSLFLTLIAYLYGIEKGRMQEPPIIMTPFQGSPGEIGFEGPRSVPRADDGAAGKIVPPSIPPSDSRARPPDAPPVERKGSPAPAAPKQPWVIRIQTVPLTPKAQELADILCGRLRLAGVPDPGTVTISPGGRKQLVVIAGGWTDRAAAEKALTALRPVIESIKGVEGFPALEGAAPWQRP
ncbi:MAG TPA: hypothetical protein DCM87_11100 [Planctomycetes bacterium]|nr:hypothetical protein [Planctomycetota bacterium]